MRILLLFFLIFSVSCSKDIVLEPMPYETKLVVDGWIENGELAQVLLTMSSPFMTEYDSASIRNTFVNYARVSIRNSIGESEVLTLSHCADFFPPFVYKTIKMKGQVGETYTLKVEARGKVLTGVTTIPALPLVDEVFMQSVSDTSQILYAIIRDDALSKNYYYSQIYTRHYDTRFHPSGNPLLNDHLFNGKEHLLMVKRSEQADPLNIHHMDTDRNILPDEFAISDTVVLKISQIDAETYRVLNGIYIDHLSQGSPFTFVDQQTPTNIQGGIGRWTGLATQRFLVHQ
ncbi:MULTISPECIES: DUF4249 domain-containing protein [unclassified Carboxylicivirga]|uniref:DUF4249 domain-containing protein n=1 Tax=Carboxylicivirga TaxID=1628153 RepID=UPI003D32845D